MQPVTIKRLEKLVWICLFTSLAGVLYQLIDEQKLNLNSVLIGLPLGLLFGFLELFLFQKNEYRFRQWSFTKLLLFKVLIYTGIIFFVTATVGLLVGFSEGKELSEFYESLLSIDQLTMVIYALVLYGLLLFLLQINQLLGEGVLWKFITGKYHKPREEERIFMFLDMRSSTTIAEQLGHERFYALLNELFHEISHPVLQTKAEIYQYVGDEVVLTWELEQGLENLNCLQTFFLFQENLRKNRESYLKKFGVNPEFKAGMHFGKVISAQIGDLKREIVYNGDVLNTAARIQGECNNYQRNFLISGSLLNRLGSINGFQSERMDSVLLRGKETEVELYSVVDLD